MDIDEFVEEIGKRYGYDDNLKIAIRQTIPLMLERYKGREEEVYSLFSNVRIFATSDMSQDNRHRIEEEMLNGVNSHVREENANPYGNDYDPGAYYSYQTVYDEDMNVTGEVRWLVVADIDDYRKDAYQALFGTTINMPYFIHEMNHAFAMQHPTYSKEGNKITSKHGMYEETVEYKDDGTGIVIDTVREEDVIIEEIVNEKITQEMLVSLLNAEDYKEVSQRLREIGHISNTYSATQILIAEELESAIGRDALDSWRIDNDLSVREKFRSTSNASKIAEVYLQGIDAYTFLSDTVFDMYATSCDAYKMSAEEYESKTRALMYDALAPIMGYQEMMGKITFDKYAEVRKNVLGEEEFSQEENKGI